MPRPTHGARRSWPRRSRRRRRRVRRATRRPDSSSTRKESHDPEPDPDRRARGAPRDRRRAALPPPRPGRRLRHARRGARAAACASARSSESGSVPELVVENPLAERVLLYDGEELVGAKQNRILNVSVLVEAKSTLTIPVSCVEQGRWSRTLGAFRARQPHLARGAAAAQGGGAGGAAARARRRAGRGLGRGAREGAAHVASTRRPARARTSTAPTSATCERSRTRSRRSRVSAARSSRLGDDLCVDVVSRPDAFARLWPKLRAGYLLDALERLDGKPTAREEIDAFVDAVDRSLAEPAALGRAGRGRAPARRAASSARGSSSTAS